MGAVGSATIERTLSVSHGASCRTLNARSATFVIPVGSFEEPDGGGGTACTLTEALPVLVSLVAVICAVPGTSDVTSPVLEFTDAIAGLALDQVTTRPVNTLPLASRSVADNCRVPPA